RHGDPQAGDALQSLPGPLPPARAVLCGVSAGARTGGLLRHLGDRGAARARGSERELVDRAGPGGVQGHGATRVTPDGAIQRGAPSQTGITGSRGLVVSNEKGPTAMGPRKELPMSESTIAQIHPVFGDILTRFGLPPRDPSLMTDQHDPATQPSLQGQRVMPKAALGTNVCIACERQSPVYALWPSCRSCSEEFCPACQQPGSIEEDEGRQSWLCPGCAADEAAVAADEPPVPADSVLVDQVAAVLVRCLAAAKGEQPQAFDELPPAERQRYRDVARIAWSLCAQEAIQIAHWIAADRLIWERTNHG